LLEKTKTLPAGRVAEIEDFVDFIVHREEQRSLTQAAAMISTTAFAAVWNNPEDHIYDVIWVWLRRLVPFTFTSLAASKRRPAIVVSSGNYSAAPAGCRRHGDHQPNAPKPDVGRHLDK